MSAPGRTHSGSIAERAITLLAERGTALRSDALAQALGVAQTSILPCLKPHVESGALVACLVTAPSGRQTYEYRTSAGGRPMDWEKLRVAGAKGGNATQRRRETPAEVKRTPAPAAPSTLAASIRQADAPAARTLELSDAVPNPGPRYGKNEIYKAMLLAMRGDMSFVVKDATMVYPVAKKLGIKITTRPDGEKVRVWRVD